MRSVPGTRTRVARKVTGALLGAGALGLLAVAFALFTLGSQLSTFVVTAELAAGAALQADVGWAMPLVLLVLTLSTVGLVLAARRSDTIPARAARVRRVRSHRGGEAAGFALREPAKALAETDQGLLRFKQ